MVSFHPFLQTGTPETLITWTCEHTKSPTHPSACITHPSSHGNLFIPSNVTHALPHALEQEARPCDNKGGQREEGGWSTHVQRVLIDDYEGHAVCHQATGVTWETETDGGGERMGDGKEIRLTQTQNTGEKLVSWSEWILKILLCSHTQTPDSIQACRPQAIISLL